MEKGGDSRGREALCHSYFPRGRHRDVGKKGTNVLSEHDGESGARSRLEKREAIVARGKDRGAFCADACA